MRIHRPIRFAAAVLAAAGLAAGAAQAAPQVGAPAPGFTAVDSSGQAHSLADYRGKTVILEWTNHECPYVGKHYGTGNMQALQKQTTADGAVWLTVISSAPGTQGYVEPAEANELTASRDAAPTAVLLDPKGEVGLAYAARTTPHMYVIDPEGTLAYMGAIDDRPTARHADIDGATNYVEAALQAMADGRPVDPALTRAYGCTVKYGS